MNFAPATTDRQVRANPVSPCSDDETLVSDARAALTPSQHVEQRLIGMLKASPLLVSQVQRQLRPTRR